MLLMLGDIDLRFGEARMGWFAEMSSFLYLSLLKLDFVNVLCR